MFVLVLSCLASCNADKPSTDTTASDTTASNSTETPPPVVEDEYINLTVSGKDISEYVISYDKLGGASVAYAAEELQSYIYKATGVRLETVGANDAADKPELKLSYNEAMGEDYTIKTDAAGITFSGGARGILYSVYNFLEDYIGWAFLPYGTDVLLCEQKSLAIDNVDVSYTQYFEYRAPHFVASFDASFSAKNMINHFLGRTGDSSKIGGWYGFWGGHSHTLAGLLGDSSYEGSIGENPCVYKEENYNKILQSVKTLLRNMPQAQIVSVSGTDSSAFCQCDGCTGKSIGGNPTDAYVNFLNRIAEEIEDDYPNVKLHMLAYGHTYDAPTKIKPHDNVIVQLANIRCCFQHPLADECCDANKDFMSHLKAWSEITDNLYMWDYATDFLYYYSTFPNFDVLRENIRTFADYGVKGVYEQGDCGNTGAKFEDLETYLIAKLLEDPYMSDEEYDALINKYMKGYYGAGWESVRAYFDFLMESSNKMGHFGIYAQPSYLYDANDFLTRGAEIEALFERAEAQVADDEVSLGHIKSLHTSFSYMRLFLIYNHIINTGTAKERNALREDCAKVFDAMVQERRCLIDVLGPLSDYAGSVNKKNHPKNWTPSGHRYEGAPNGMPGSDELGDFVYGNS